MERRIEGIMYGKFTANDKRGSLLYANRKGVTVIDKPFSKVLEEVMEEKVVINENVDKRITVADSNTEVQLLWQGAIHKNHLKIRGGK